MCVLLDAPGSQWTCHGLWMRMRRPPASWHSIPCGLSGPRLVATCRARSSPSPWHVEVMVSARRAVHVLGCVCLCAHGPWGHWGTNHWVVRCPTAVCHALHRSRVPDFGPNWAKFAKTCRGFSMRNDGTGRSHWCWCVLLDAPGSQWTCHGLWMWMWRPPASWHSIPCGLSGPRLATCRAGSWPSPWHVEVVASARRAVHVLGCVCLCAHGPRGHWGTNHWVVRCPMAVCHALQRPRVPDFGPIYAKFANT